MINPTSVFYQGEPGAYSQLAALTLFPGRVPAGYPQFADVFQMLKTAKDPVVAVLPIENSIYGSVHPVLDLLQTNPFPIIGEYKLRVQHCLVALNKSSFSQITEVYSHPQALGQCETFFRLNPQIKPVAWPDTAGAARYLAENPSLSHVAVIASEQAASVYGLTILRKNIESFAHNFTRFVVVSTQPAANPEANKTSIWFEAKDVPGSLYHCLGCFATRQINLLKIESRPVWGKAWKQVFYVDFRGTTSDAPVIDALEELRPFTESVHILGSYPEDRAETGHQAPL